MHAAVFVQSSSEVSAQQWNAVSMSGRESAILAAGGGQLQSMDSSWVRFQQFQPKGFLALRVMAIGPPALYILVYCVARVADPDWVDSHSTTYFAHTRLGMCLLYLVCLRMVMTPLRERRWKAERANDPSLGIKAVRGKVVKLHKGAA